VDDRYTINKWSPETDPGEQLGRALVLPGARYSVDNPILFWTCQVLAELGWRVMTMRWQASDITWSDARAFVERGADLLDAAAGASTRTLVVGKSLSSCAVPWASNRRYPAIWLTPVMTEEFVAAGLRSYPAPSLLVGGTADGLWSAPSITPPDQRVLEIEGADHGLERRGSWRDSITDLRDVLDAVERFARGLA